ncbi:MAG: hypothetical protein M3Q03_12630 [Chloroflexota bacterium]|nr:hypothetical protein [Chloroflexota bacterium]
MATANLSGRVLADLITGTESELTALPMAVHRPRLWEIERLRWLGVRFVTRSRQGLLRRVELTGRYPERPALAQRLWDF